MFFKIGVLKNFFLIKLQAWRPATLLKKRLQDRCFPVNIAKFLSAPFLWNTCGGIKNPFFFYSIARSNYTITSSNYSFTW